MGLCTGWFWDDAGLTYTKRCLAAAEKAIGDGELAGEVYFSEEERIPTPQIGFIESEMGEDDDEVSDAGTERPIGERAETRDGEVVY
ncbi:hypothetical protein VC83_09043 [Pseudogymnoascus destructans]|uniref:Uncharacterized protein n=1 Tax=Pseudogymnoascus destructans TaxID=655981 RepID=A0A176ZX66_9PEZI|nr:uncharacterized protein VC83_09043 [Pseudogymnoascus destructans]OAF54585.1 hypothetical protein VC83_09043 [Pseudogymnoascus destructans]